MVRDVFFKYYANELKAKCFVEFEQEPRKLIRKTHSKYAEKVDDYMHRYLEDIKKKMIKIRSDKPVNRVLV